MPKQVKVLLGGREYIVAEKFSGLTERWRKHLRESAVFVTLQSLDDVVALVGKVIDANDEKLDVASITSLARFVPAILNSLSNSMDDIKALTFDYVPEMKADEEWIAENVYDSEIVAAFVEVLKINFPIMAALDLLRGSKAPGISTNLPSMNGAIGTKKPTARLKTR